jgi:hypothetical protein
LGVEEVGEEGVGCVRDVGEAVFEMLVCFFVGLNF